MSTNKVYLAGIVRSDPDFAYDAILGDYLKIELEIRRKDLGKCETITAIVTQEDLIKDVIKNVKKGDYFLTLNAHINTINYSKTVEKVCSHCQEATYVNIKAEKTEVVVTDYECVHDADPRLPGINKVILSGNVCSALNIRTNPTTNKPYCKYKLAVDRIGKAKTLQEADYPFIVSFGREAANSAKHLHLSSMVLIEGALQERNVTQRFDHTCENCGQSMSIKRGNNIVREIIASSVEYLDKHKDNEEEESSNQNECAD